jgi:radical SAM enzyme (TIGR04100 family)
MANNHTKSDIIYTFEGNPYLNLTNRCPCACTFCIRQNADALGSAENLWHKKDPSFEQIKSAIDSFDFTGVKEITFCGYGEPTEAYDNMIKTAKYIRSIHPEIKIRLNTNGLSDLVNGRKTAKEICENVDTVSVSLNAPNSKRYNELCRPKFDGAYDAIKKFISECATYLDDVRCSVVDVITDEETKQCVEVANSLGAKMRVREKE